MKNLKKSYFDVAPEPRVAEQETLDFLLSQTLERSQRYVIPKTLQSLEKYVV